MGQPRLADEDCHQVRPGVVTTTNEEGHHCPQVTNIFHLMGLGDAQGSNYTTAPTSQVQVLAQTQHPGDGSAYPWAYTTTHQVHHQPQQEFTRSQPIEYFTQRIPSISNKRNNSWNNKNAGRYPRHTRDDASTYRNESSPNSHFKNLSYESLTELGVNDSKSIKRHHQESYSVPPYPPPSSYFQPYGQEFISSNTYHHHSQQQYTTYYNNNSQAKRRYNGRNSFSYNNVSSRSIAIAPDRFLNRAHLVHVSSTPSELLTGGLWDQLSEEVFTKFMKCQQTEEMFRKKMLLWKHLYVYIKATYPRYGLYLVGSTMTGFGSITSDVDMCLLVRHTEMDQRCEAVFHLELVMNHLHSCDDIEHVELIQAKVPILKFRDAKQGLEIDLNCNNAVGIRNTHLLYCYANMDWRVRPLVLVVKLWAQQQGINDAKNMTISSYSLALMVINYLQCGARPSVLPSLQLMYPHKFHVSSLIPQIDLHEELPPHHTENKQTLGELMLGFLDYYSNQFDFSQVAASVRLASTVSIEECRRARSLKNDPHQWKYLCIEEPFELTNTARSVYDRVVFERVKSVFINSCLQLKSTRKLESIFEVTNSKKSE